MKECYRCNIFLPFDFFHIDHKKPVSLFQKDTDISIVNSLDNLQPLWAIDNLSKKAKYI